MTILFNLLIFSTFLPTDSEAKCCKVHFVPETFKGSKLCKLYLVLQLKADIVVVKEVSSISIQ
jgi:hypothetical protein